MILFFHFFLQQNNRTIIFYFIDRNYKEATLQEISQLNGYTANYLSHLLKEQTGNTFKQLLRLRKLRHAAYLLENSSISIMQIMNDIGYENSSFFTAFFRKCFNVPRKSTGKSTLPAPFRAGNPALKGVFGK